MSHPARPSLAGARLSHLASAQARASPLCNGSVPSLPCGNSKSVVHRGKAVLLGKSTTSRARVKAPSSCPLPCRVLPSPHWEQLRGPRSRAVACPNCSAREAPQSWFGGPRSRAVASPNCKASEAPEFMFGGCRGERRQGREAAAHTLSGPSPDDADRVVRLVTPQVPKGRRRGGGLAAVEWGRERAGFRCRCVPEGRGHSVACRPEGERTVTQADASLQEGEARDGGGAGSPNSRGMGPPGAEDARPRDEAGGSGKDAGPRGEAGKSGKAELRGEGDGFSPAVAGALSLLKFYKSECHSNHKP